MNDDGGCFISILGIGIVVVLGIAMTYYSHGSYVKRKAHCKAQGGQWIEAMGWDESKCIEAAEKGVGE